MHYANVHKTNVHEEVQKLWEEIIEFFSRKLPLYKIRARTQNFSNVTNFAIRYFENLRSYKLCARWRPKFFTEDHKTHHMTAALIFIETYNEHGEWLHCVVTEKFMGKFRDLCVHSAVYAEGSHRFSQETKEIFANRWKLKMFECQHANVHALYCTGFRR